MIKLAREETLTYLCGNDIGSDEKANKRQILEQWQSLEKAYSISIAVCKLLNKIGAKKQRENYCLQVKFRR